MTFAIVASGYHPRCALDSTDGAEVRVVKIACMIGECDWGIHDLSRVEVAPGGLPRFNMPMELGLHLGQDVESHGNDPGKAIRCVRNWLSDHRPHKAPPLAGAAAMQGDYRLFNDQLADLLKPRRLDPDTLTHSDFLFAALDWMRDRTAREPPQ